MLVRAYEQNSRFTGNTETLLLKPLTDLRSHLVLNLDPPLPHGPADAAVLAQLETEIAKLNGEATELATEIEELTGQPAPGGDATI